MLNNHLTDALPSVRRCVSENIRRKYVKRELVQNANSNVPLMKIIVEKGNKAICPLDLYVSSDEISPCVKNSRTGTCHVFGCGCYYGLDWTADGLNLPPCETSCLTMKLCVTQRRSNVSLNMRNIMNSILIIIQFVDEFLCHIFSKFYFFRTSLKASQCVRAI
jgi:hypothetical protein